MPENNTTERFECEYRDAIDMRYLPAAAKTELLIDMLDRKYKRGKGTPEIIRKYYRIKEFEEVCKKAKHKGIVLELAEVEANVRDIVGFRIVTTFIHDIYEIANDLSKIPGLNVIKVKDYIKNPKPSGYRSLHLIALVEVYNGEMSTIVPVEIQIRDVLMDAWSCIEHRMRYKANIESESLDESFVKHAEVLSNFDAEINDYEINEDLKKAAQAAADSAKTNVARVAAIEQKVES